MQLVINGQAREIESLATGATVAVLVAALGMQADRVALEQNGEIVARAAWAATVVSEGDRFELVHFVGGGLPAPEACLSGEPAGQPGSSSAGKRSEGDPFRITRPQAALSCLSIRPSRAIA